MPSPDAASPSQYRCFENSIRLYKFFGFFSEDSPGTGPRRVINLIPWLSWYWFTLSLVVNLSFVLKNYLTNPGTAIKGTEIFQRVFEIFLAPMFVGEMHYFATSYYAQVQEMRRSFDTHPAVTGQCKAREKKVVILSIALVLFTMSLAYYRKLFLGLPPNEVELVKYYYHKARPERQLPLVMWFPFDDTVDPFYYVALCMNVYLMLVTGLLATHSNSCMLIFAIHLQGQFLILAKYLQNIGNPYLFVYQDTRTGGEVAQREDRGIESVHLMNLKGESTGEARDLRATTRMSSTSLEHNLGAEYFANLQRALAQGRNFERDCLTLIIRRHQYLIDFRNRLEERFKVMILSKMLTYITLTISLYQMSFVSALDAFAVQLFLQLLYTLSFCFVITHASEMLERGNEAVRRAAYENNWTRRLHFAQAQTSSTHAQTSSTHAQRSSTHAQRSSTHAQRSSTHAPRSSTHAQRSSTHAHKTCNANALLLFTLMCDRSLRLKYFGGSLELCYRSFVTVLRFCYSLFALMKRSIQVK